MLIHSIKEKGLIIAFMDDKGQAMAEYALILFFVMLSLFSVLKTFGVAMAHYFNIVISITMLPIP